MNFTTSRIYLFIALITILLSFTAMSVAQAANPKNWWVDIANDRVDNVKAMLNQGADPNEISPQGYPAIMYAIRESAWDTYELLAANRKTALNAINTNRETALMYLAVVGETARAEQLIKRGAQVNRLGWTPLHYAASTGKTDTASMLLRYDAYVNATTNDGTTPLMMAAYAGSEPTVRLLLKAGADLHLQTEHGYTVVDWANFKNNTALSKKLQNLIDQQLGTFEELTVEQENEASSRAENKSQSPTSKYFDLDRDFNEDISP